MQIRVQLTAAVHSADNTDNPGFFQLFMILYVNLWGNDSFSAISPTVRQEPGAKALKIRSA